MVRVAVLNSHPTAYMAPFYKVLSDRSDLEITVLYNSLFGTARDQRPMLNFGRTVVWDVDPTAGHSWKLFKSPVEVHPQRRATVHGLGLLRELTADRYDVLVTYGWATPACWLSFLLAKRRGIPCLLYGDTNARDAGKHLSAPLRAVMMKTLVRLTAGALYTGTFNRDFYIRAGMRSDRLWFSPYAVDTPRFAAGDRAATRERLGLDEDTVYVLFVGTLVPRKRPLELLEAVAEVQRQGHRVGALFAGTGELEDALRARASDGVRDVHMLGFVNQTALPDLYAACDVFALPSVRDPRATVVNEAMAAGRPVIVSTGTGVWGPGDLVEHGREGLVVETDDRAALVSALSELLDAGTRRRMGEAAAERARWWSFERAADGWSKAAHALVASSDGSA